MTPIKILLDELEWISKDTAYNLDFIPAEKFDWKPAPKANSAQDIVNHVINNVPWTIAMLHGTIHESRDLSVKNREEAKRAIMKSFKDYKKAIKDFDEKELARVVKLPWGERTVFQVIQLVVTDMIHHQGQITYIQTLLGDTEMHFVPEDWKG